MTAEQLRNSILQEAISGQLVPQDPNEDAEDVKTIEIEDAPFEIPNNWRWCSLGDLVDMVSGTSYKKDDVRTKGVRILRGGNIVNDELVLAEDDVFLPDEYANLEKNIRKDDIIIVASTGSQKVIGKPALIRQNYDKTQIGAFLRIIRAKDVKYVPFLWLIFKGMYYREHIRNLVKGTNINNIKEEYITTLPIPLPPLAEQKRIVAKLEELLPIVEQYGKAQKELDELNAALPTRLRQSILQEAIHGKLVPQDEKEGTAEELLKLIDAEKQRLVKERILKKAIRTSAIIPEDSPLEIPTSWLWANLEDVTYAVGGRENQILSKEILKEGKIRVVSQGQAIYDGYCNDATKEINDLPVILFGDHTRNVKYIDFPFVIGADGTKLFRPIGIYPRYLYYWMKYAASSLRNRGYARHYTLLKVVPVPLPPLAEQMRIVAKIEELFEQINRLSEAK